MTGWTTPTTTPTRMHATRSIFDTSKVVKIDPYSANPIIDDARQASGAYQAALKGGPPPLMFQGGTSDLPAFTASGIDPALLMKLPFTQRHAAAAETDPSIVHSNFEQFSHLPDYEDRHQGLDDARARVRFWLRNSGLAEQNAAAAQASREKRAMDTIMTTGLPTDRLIAMMNENRK